MMTSRIPVITVFGEAFTVGVRHAKATMGLRGEVASFVNQVREAFPSRVISDELEAIAQTLSQHSPDTLQQISGMAQVYELSESDMLLSVLQSYFDSFGKSQQGADQGCSTYAYASEKGTALVKNRDSGRKFLDRQTILQVSDGHRFAWTALSTAGAPGVHSAGMNERGLSIVDTHVPSQAVGAGLPRFSMMMNVLQECQTVAESIDYYNATPSMGFGNLVLQDKSGAMAVIECGYLQSGFIRPSAAFLVATNHFVTDEMKVAGLLAADGHEGLDSRRRKALLEAELNSLGDGVLDDPSLPMRQHQDSPIGSLCVHEEASPTIATIVMNPRKGEFGVAHGNPCVSQIATYSAHPQDWIDNA